MKTIHSIAVLKSCIAAYKKSGETVAFVPTMGDLHEGHLSLITAAQQACKRVVVSIFVNPLQFGPNEDFHSYTRRLDEDAQRLRQANVDILFSPEIESVYSAEDLSQCVRVEIPSLNEQLCGRFRPGHFSGVATVVCKLFNMVQPDIAFFGEKDYQQLLVIRKMVTDLHFSIEIHGVPTVREDDGLAMSSRNRYLDGQERILAAKLYATLQSIAKKIEAGNGDFFTLSNDAMDILNKKGFVCDYIEVRRADNLAPATPNDTRLRVLAAATLGKARLIDNLPVFRQN